ncbi:hypothetical protein [Neotamlana laminarinivorans]|uniref:Uncharacterized protein n=1 Tax=Neotamlana laminarinivorans TaxID=2883124 RepID=A0A9X1L333_9FLAO|nr:hypothetical protein [Tamlana laminarinivorans]MCB4797847.1 hypothetical protein [Tamlana laminarinivorans]
MKKLFTILALIAAILTVILSILPVSNLAIFPGILALIFGGTAYYFSKKTGEIKKLLPFTIMLTVLALVLTSYKAFFTETIVEDTKALEATEVLLQEESLEELEDLDIEEIELDDSELEDLSIDETELEELNIEENIESLDEIDAKELENIEIDAVEDIEIDESELNELEIDQ